MLTGNVIKEAFVMMSAINGMSSYMSQSTLSISQQREDRFARVDQNGDGGVDKTELQTLLDKVSLHSGTSIDAEEALEAFDADGDGVLSQEETEELMASVHEKLGPPPPPPGAEGVSGASESEEDAVVEMLSQQEEEDEAASSVLQMLQQKLESTSSNQNQTTSLSFYV